MGSTRGAFRELEVLRSMQGLRRANQGTSQAENVREPSVTQFRV